MECVSSDATRGIINGTFIDAGNPKAGYVVGTDGKHLYSANSFALPLKDSVVIPPHKFLGWSEFNKDGEWQVKSDAENVQISSRRWRFITRQPMGKYPDWRQVVPDPSHARTHITIDPAKLEPLTRLLQRMPCHDDRCCTGVWNGSRSNCSCSPRINHTDPWLRIPVADVKGEGPDVGIFLDRRIFIKALSYGLNTISLIDELSPMRFSNGGKQLIVMPVRADHRHTQEERKPAEVTERPKEPAPTPAQPPHPTPMAVTPDTITPSSPPPPAACQVKSVPDREQAATPPTLEEAIAMTSTLRDLFQDAGDTLRALSVRLRHIQREQKTNSKEMDSVRSTLRSLQGLKL